MRGEGILNLLDFLSLSRGQRRNPTSSVVNWVPPVDFPQPKLLYFDQIGPVTYLFREKEERKMKINRFSAFAVAAIFLGGLAVSCGHRMDTMSTAEKIFIKKIDKTAGKLDLNEDQKAKLEGLKAEVRKNFEEGQKENREAWTKIKEEATKENPDIQKMTFLLQGMLSQETQRFNKAFDLLLGFQNNLNDAQKMKLAQMISKKVKKLD